MMSEKLDAYNEFETILKNEEEDLTKIFLSLFSLPDEDFEILKPLLLENLSDAFKDPRVQLQILNELEQSGVSLDEISNSADIIIEAFGMADVELSESKKDVLKTIFTEMRDGLSNTPLNPNRNVIINVELCRDGARLPAYATDGSAAMDIYSTEEYVINPGETIIIPTGLKVSIPKGYALLIQPRSGMSVKTKLRIANTPGLIDSDYHEEIGVIVENIMPNIVDLESNPDNPLDFGVDWGGSYTIGKGERFAQMRLVEVPRISWNQVSSLGEFINDHGKGFGGTGIK